MTSLLLLVLGCERPAPLPPKVQQPLVSDERMVQMDAFRGYLSRPQKSGSHRAVLVVSETLDEVNRARVQTYPGQTVLVIESSASVPSAMHYLLGLSDVSGVDAVCAMQHCESLSGAVRDPE